MTKEQLDFLCEICDRQGIGYNIQNEYSGRGMYGKTTHALIIEDPVELLRAALNYMTALIRKNSLLIPEFDKELRTDHMGRDEMILY